MIVLELNLCETHCLVYVHNTLQTTLRELKCHLVSNYIKKGA